MAIPPDLESADAKTRFLRTNDLVNEMQDEIAELLRMRREAATELVAEGHSQAVLGKWSGMSRARIGQLLTSGPKPERVLLGTGSTVTVAIGGKPEGSTASPASTSAVVSQEATEAFDLLQELAATYSMKAVRETVPPPGWARLNRTSLIVIGSPKVVPSVLEIIEGDPHYQFEQRSGNRWNLVDLATDERLESPAENGGNADYAYVARLPRPDGRGSFLYLAGLHAMGTKGAAQYLVDNIDAIYAEVKSARAWSMLVACRYDERGSNREIAETTILRELRLF